MGRRSRHSAKTGDSALYKSRDGDGENAPSKRRDDSDDDAMYNEVDRHHNRQEAEREELLRLDGGGSDGSDDDANDDGITRGREAVFDLGVGGSDDDDDDSSSDSDSDGGDRDGRGRSNKSDSDSDDGDASSSDSDSSVPDDDDLRGLKSSEDVLDWGARKSAYYHGDTADLELGQDEGDAELEEEAGREVLRKRMEEMDEGDFMLDDDDEEEAADSKVATPSKKKSGAEAPPTSDVARSSSAGKLAKLSKADRRRLLDAAHPEFLPLVEHFRDGPVRELRDVTRVLCGALLGANTGGGGDDDRASFQMEDAEAVGATPAGLRYLLTKALLQTSSALNVCQYLLLKSERGSSNNSAAANDRSNNDSDDEGSNDDEDEEIRSHPVISRLRELNDLSDRLADDVEAKVPDLREQVEGLVKAARLLEAERKERGAERDEDGHSGNDDDDGSADYSDDAEAETAAFTALAAKKTAGARAEDAPSDSDSSDEDEKAVRHRAAAEARFALRRGEDGSELSTSDKKKSKRRRRPAPAAVNEYGDEEEDEDDDRGRKLARTVNALSQRGDAKRKKKAGSTGAEAVDDQDGEKFRRGLEMMEAELGGGGSGDDDGNGSDMDDELDDGLGDDDADGGFYAKVRSKSSAKKSTKKAKYAVAPKYPNLDVEVVGERGVSQYILKNRGLVAHKNKLNRNPRVKKREQYRRALVRRKGAVREVRTDEGHQYGGEGTGIKAGISRSRKIGVRP